MSVQHQKSPGAANPRNTSQSPEWWLLPVGLLLLMLPIVVALTSPSALAKTEFFLRVVTALGGGLIGGFIPGVLQVTLPGAKAAGALGVLVLIYNVNPPQLAVSSMDDPAPSPASPTPPKSPQAGDKRETPMVSQPAPTEELQSAKSLSTFQQAFVAVDSSFQPLFDDLAVAERWQRQVHRRLLCQTGSHG